MNKLLKRYQVWYQEHFWQFWILICGILIIVLLQFKSLSLYEGVQILVTVTLVFITSKYAIETAKIRKANTEMVEQMKLQSERPYIIGLIKSTIQPLEAELEGLIDRHKKRKFDWRYADKETVKAVKFKIEELELFQSDDRYYIPWPHLIISGLLGRVPNDSDISYYAYLLERNSHLKELIDQYNPEAENLWAQLYELAVVLVKSEFKDALRELLTTHHQTYLIPEFPLSDNQLLGFKQAAQEYCLYLASSKLLMESNAYAEFMATNWASWKESAIWSFWRNWQDNLMQNMVTDESIKQLQASILEKSEILASDVRTIEGEVLKIKENYMRRHNVLPEEIEPPAYLI